MLLRKKVAFEEDAILLRGLNNYRDIVPTDGAKRLHKSGEMPVDGIFLGRSWYGLERARYGTFRWVNNDAEIVVTKPSGLKKRLVLDVEPGPALGATALKLDLVDSGGNSVAKSEISHRMNVSLDLPAISQRSFTVHLHVEEGGLKSPAEGESRILNFRVFGIRWE